MDEFRLQAEWEQEEEDKRAVEAFKVDLLARRERARQHSMTHTHSRPDPRKFLLQLEVLQQTASSGEASLHHWHTEP